MSGEFMTYETYLRQQVDKGCYGVAIISAETALDIANFIEKQRERIAEADRKTENSSEKPNNCEYAENPSGDVWECGCFLDTYCEHQIYDRNPDGTINIVECGYEPKDEPQRDCLTCRYNSDEWDSPKCDGCSKANSHYEPQTEREGE